MKYDPNLIDKFKNDHKEIVGLYTSVDLAARQGNFDMALSLLQEFHKAIAKHVALEKIKFYIYVEFIFSQKKKDLSSLKKIRIDMENISSEVSKFSKKYILEGLTQLSSQNQFIKDFEEIGVILTQRVKMEEKDLYPLYIQ